VQKIGTKVVETFQRQMHGLDHICIGLEEYITCVHALQMTKNSHIVFHTNNANLDCSIVV
jgi:hypothetical protein